MSTTAAKKIQTALTNLLLDEPFFGTIAFQLKYIADPNVQTTATDGKVVKYNPEDIDTLSVSNVINELLHEIGHVTKLHPYRRGTRDHKLFNVACDYVINNELIASRYKLTADFLQDKKYTGMSEEQVYTLLQQLSKKEQESLIAQSEKHGQSEDAQEQPGESKEEQQQQIKQMVLQAAMVAKAAGKLPGFARLLVDNLLNPVVDWRSALMKYLEQTAKNDFSWVRPNVRYMAHNIYLPALKSEQLPPVVVYWDTSGSRWSNVALKLAATEIVALAAQAKPSRLIIIQGDSKVTDVQDLLPEDSINLEAKGGGGTHFEPIFEQVEKMEVEPCCFIGITDLAGSFPNEVPNYPVVWLCDERGMEAPFGDIIEVNL